MKKYNSFTRFRILRSSEYLLRIILIETFALVVLLVCLLLFNVVALGRTYIHELVIISFGILVYLSVATFFIYRKHIRFGAWMLVVLYGIIGECIVYNWGLNEPIGIFLLIYVIFLTSVLLRAKQILIVTTGIIGTLVFLQYLNIIGIIQPDQSMIENESSYIDVAGCVIILSVFAVISWVSGVKTEGALERTIKAEVALQEERDALASRVEEQNKSLMIAQQKELKQLYKFAELGQLTTIILHELANYLSILTLDIDDIKERHQNSIAIEHAKESIFYIDSIIDQVRNQIKDSDDTQKFDALSITKDSLEQLRMKLTGTNIKLFIEDNRPKNYLIFGDPLRLSQAITILVTNATQASKDKQAEISVEVSSTKSKILITVKDFGTGITPDVRRTLFEPQKSRKGAGLGIGLYVTKQIIDTHFKGNIWLSPATEYTQFNIEIPRTRLRN